MANIKTTLDEWVKCREYYEAGLSLSKIVEKTGISKTQISKRSNAEGWAKGTEKEQLIADAVRVAVAKGTLTEQALIIHNEVVDERTKHLQFFTNASLKNVSVMMKKIGAESSISEHRQAQTALKDAKEVVLGKTPDTAIQINNGPSAYVVSPGKALSMEEWTQETAKSKMEEDA